MKRKMRRYKNSTGQTVFVPLIGVVAAEKLTAGDLIGVNRLWRYTSDQWRPIGILGF